MRNSTRLVLTRRQALQAASVAALVLTTHVDWSQATKSAATDATADAAFLGSSFEALAATFFGTDWAHEGTALFPVELRVRSKVRARLSLDWDERLFSIPGSVLALTGNLMQSLAVTRQSANFLEVEVPVGVTRVIVRGASSNLYPNENIATPRPTVARLRALDGTMFDERVFETSATACVPWSVEATVDWISLEGLVVPARAVLASVGPGPIPKGISFSLTSPDVLEDPQVLDGAGSQATTVTVGKRRSRTGIDLELTVAEEIAAGTSAQVILVKRASDSIPTGSQKEIPRLLMTSAPEPGMRRSGRHAVFPLTSSGSQLSTYAAAPTA